MKTENQATASAAKTGKATARPWRVVENRGIYSIWSIESDRPGSWNNYVVADDIQTEAEACLIVRAVNEHAALVAVAEAAEKFSGEFTMKLAHGFAPKMYLDEMREVLANLEAVRRS
jgi:hypothetical protein